MKGKIIRIGKVEERHGRLNVYKLQSLMLDVTPEDGAPRQSLFGTLFGHHVDTLAALAPQYGDTLEFDCVFTTSERNSFVTNYIEIENPRRA